MSGPQGRPTGVTSVAGPAPTRRRLAHLLPPLALIGLLVGAWEAYADADGASRLFLPAPHSVLAALWRDAPLISENLATTAQIVGLGLALSILAGFLAAIAIHFSGLLRRAVYPLAVGSQSIPIALIGALLVFWWGFGMLPKLVVVILICFFPVLVTTVDALGGVDRNQLKLLRTLGASRWQAFRFAELPSALPAALSGARIAVAVAVIGADIAEISTAGTSSGLGHEIQLDLNAVTGHTPRAWAAALVLCLLALAAFYAFGLIERRLAPWATRTADHLA